MHDFDGKPEDLALVPTAAAANFFRYVPEPPFEHNPFKTFLLALFVNKTVCFRADFAAFERFF